MGSRPLGELLVRPSTFTRSPFCQSCNIRRIAPSWTTQRCISSTPSQPTAQPQRKDDDFEPEHSAPNSQQSPFASPRQEQRQPPSRNPAVRRTSPADTSQAIDSLFSGMPSQRQSTPHTTRTQTTSSDEMRAARSKRIFGSEFSNGISRRGSRAPPRLNFDDMTLPSDMLDPNLSNKPSEAANLVTQQEETFANYPRLNPTYGRAVDLDASRGRDLVRGIGMLGSLMARNSIRKDMMKQRFHERGGLKRKRLNSERWRARFKKGFTEVTARVSELTRKGW
ncbi:hypothetical protein EK21DRAFT_96952 [Setomelanomma holmii]|uniref:Ribosomal protein S21 n=1 Tax=Setomelanomma holmii TaxID=210430 RepID=A0A9P4LRD8_9PLEO|nr:hypothetical protein EK21DRAFT_96952 [Setomelanomma holmii]